MKKKKIVIALGGNAILSENASAEAQQKALENTAKYLIEFIKQGHQLVISHGNGPQVGNLLLQQIAADSRKNPAMPLDTCVAMTQGSIGYWLQNTLQNQLMHQDIDKEVLSTVTQVVVHKDDTAFEKPTKPVGPFLTREEAETEQASTGAVFAEDAGRGWRKVVPSPMPITIKEAQAIKKMIEHDIIVICTGGGGIPVIETKNGYEGVEAVIDKDFAAQKLAELIEADLFIVLTGVDHVYVNFNTKDQKKLTEISVDELKEYIEEGHFAPGSMLPKIEAAISFVEKTPKGKAIITSLERVSELVHSNAGTVISM